MADYPGKVISGGLICGAINNSLAYRSGNSILLIATSKSFGLLINFSLVTNALGKSTGRSLYQQINNVLSQNRAYFNNAFSQDLNNIYLNKSVLGLTSGLNLSLEALFVAVLIQWANNIGLGSESKIQSQWLSYGDLDNGYIYFVIQITFRKAVTVADTYEIQPIYTISPLGF